MRASGFALGLAGVFATVPLFGRTIRVSATSPRGEFSDVQQAIDHAEDGDVLEVEGGNVAYYTWEIEEPLDFRGKAITVRFHGATVRLSRTPRDPARACVVYFGSGETGRSVLDEARIEAGPGYEGAGGAIYCEGSASPSIQRCTIFHSKSASSAVVLSGTARLLACDFWGNVGCAVFCAPGSAPHIAGCAISETLGPALRCAPDSKPSLVACRIQGNASGPDAAPAILCDPGSTVDLLNCIVADNQGDGILSGGMAASIRFSTIAANGGAGIRGLRGSRISVDSAIVWGNAEGGIRVEEGAETQVAFSIVEGPQVWPGEGNLLEDPLFFRTSKLDWSRFDANGYPDFLVERSDYRVRWGSPAMDAGNPSAAPETDFWGNPRPRGNGPDMGAWERVVPAFRRGDCNVDGKVDVSDAICILCFLFSGCWEPCHETANSNDDGSVNITDAVYVLNWLFLGGPDILAPGPFECGFDPEDSPHIGCESYPLCE